MQQQYYIEEQEFPQQAVLKEPMYSYGYPDRGQLSNVKKHFDTVKENLQSRFKTVYMQSYESPRNDEHKQIYYTPPKLINLELQQSQVQEESPPDKTSQLSTVRHHQENIKEAQENYEKTRFKTIYQQSFQSPISDDEQQDMLKGSKFKKVYKGETDQEIVEQQEKQLKRNLSLQNELLEQIKQKKERQENNQKDQKKEEFREEQKIISEQRQMHEKYLKELEEMGNVVNENKIRQLNEEYNRYNHYAINMGLNEQMQPVINNSDVNVVSIVEDDDDEEIQEQIFENEDIIDNQEEQIIKKKKKKKNFQEKLDESEGEFDEDNQKIYNRIQEKPSLYGLEQLDQELKEMRAQLSVQQGLLNNDLKILKEQENIQKEANVRSKRNLENLQQNLNYQSVIEEIKEKDMYKSIQSEYPTFQVPNKFYQTSDNQNNFYSKNTRQYQKQKEKLTDEYKLIDSIDNLMYLQQQSNFLPLHQNTGQFETSTAQEYDSLLKNRMGNDYFTQSLDFDRYNSQKTFLNNQEIQKLNELQFDNYELDEKLEFNTMRHLDNLVAQLK